MRRRKAVKAIALSAVTPQLFFRKEKINAIPAADTPPVSTFESSWHRWPDMLWTGPEVWGNRLQDWQTKNGRAVCVVSSAKRSLHCLTCQLTENKEAFESSVILEWLNHGAAASGKNHAGFMVGAKGDFEDYRSAAVFGDGLQAGIGGDGKLFIGETKSEKNIATTEKIQLRLVATPSGNHYSLRLAAQIPGNGNTIDEVVASDIPSKDVAGNIALISHFADAEDTEDISSVAFESWIIKGRKVRHDASQSFGPVCFSQYTLHKKILKLTAQLAPIERVGGHRISLQIMENRRWKTVDESPVDPLGRSAQFRVENWAHREKIPYRVRVELPLKDGNREYFYEGEIAREPLDQDRVKLAVFSCNADYGFPDADVPLHVRKHRPDAAVFLGDQFYERTGGFGIETSPLEKSSLDYLRKWYMFGWSYRDVFRRIPSACIPDDHDVYHGNVWGAGGKKAPTDHGWGYPAQDQGGYKMPPEWVNMVQRTQTSHLPDAFDPRPVEQGIGVYYTAWNYAGISMAILEDRKFKSAPKQVLPPEAKVVNGFIQNRDFDIREYYDIDAQLLGDRQMRFLEDWSTDWKDGAVMKVVLSQTNFCTVATLPEGSILDDMVPRLPIPAPGEYVKGDAPTTDMDSNGWPQKGRDAALKVIRKCFALHLAGDQHLASMIHYGVEEHADAGYAFAGPALNNIWPRRWWPPLDGRAPLAGAPPYTGNFEDGFGNKMTVLAVANPRQTGKMPAVIHDRATGYGIVTFDKENRTMKIECWPRYADPESDPNGQYKGWPVTISQEENYGRKGVGYLPELEIEGARDPVIEVVNERTGEMEYILRIKGNRFRPKVFGASTTYTAKVSDPETGKEKMIGALEIASGDSPSVKIKL